MKDITEKKSARGAAFLLAAAAALLLVGDIRVSRADADEAENIALVGIDSAGHSVTRAVPSVLYRNAVATAVASVHDSMLPALASSGNKASAWRLNTLGVGIGISGQIGLGPIVNLTLGGRLRLIFTRAVHPAYPDL